MDIEHDLKKYFLIKGYSNTLKNYDLECKNDPFSHILDPDFCVKKIHNSIISSDFTAHRDNWKVFTQCFGTYLSPQHFESFEKLKIESWKTFLSQACKHNKFDKVNEAICHLTSFNEDFKEWIVLSSINYPIKHKTFGIYFAKSWMNAFLISLHNMFSMIIGSIITNKSIYLQQMKIENKLTSATEIIAKKTSKKSMNC